MTEEQRDLLRSMATTVRWLAMMESSRHPNAEKQCQIKYVTPIDKALNRMLMADYPKQEEE